MDDNKKRKFSDSSDNKTCGICKENVAKAERKAIFTAECEHLFHFGCITQTHGDFVCPVCTEKYRNNCPSVTPKVSSSSTLFSSPQTSSVSNVTPVVHTPPVIPLPFKQGTLPAATAVQTSSSTSTLVQNFATKVAPAVPQSLANVPVLSGASAPPPSEGARPYLSSFRPNVNANVNSASQAPPAPRPVYSNAFQQEPDQFDDDEPLTDDDEDSTTSSSSSSGTQNVATKASAASDSGARAPPLSEGANRANVNPVSQTPPAPPPVYSSTLFQQEPVRFDDDEPLPAATAAPTSSSLRSGSQNVTIKAVPERDGLASSETVDNFSVLIGLCAPPLSEGTPRAPIDLVMVLDVSTSMYGQRLALVKQAAGFVIDNLGPTDRLSVLSFSSRARRVLPLRTMTENGRVDAKKAVESLYASGNTNIVDGLTKGARVLEERKHRNPVAAIMFLSDGCDTCNYRYQIQNASSSGYLHLLPASIHPGDDKKANQEVIPVHTFGFGTGHDPVAMHAIADSSGGTFSFIEDYEMVQDAFASCIGGLLSVVVQELRLMLRSASDGVDIKSIPSGRYASEISDQRSRGKITVGDLYADEEKEFLVNVSVPKYINTGDGRKTSLLDITCSYKDTLSNETVLIDFVEIRRPRKASLVDKKVKLEVDRQRNRLNASEGIAEAQIKAEEGDLTEARDILSNTRSSLRASESGQAGDSLIMWVEAELKETEEKMGSREMYEEAGRAYALSNMNAHAYQRATTRGGASDSGGGDAYATPNMAIMVSKSQKVIKTEYITPKEE